MSQATVTKADEFLFNRNVGQVVRTLLHARQHTVGELGIFLDCTRNNAQAKLSGKTKFTAYELRMLADWFGVTPEVFYRPPADLFRPGLLAATADHAGPDGGALSRYVTTPLSPVSHLNYAA